VGVATIVRRWWWAVAVMLLGLPPACVLAVEAGGKWQAVLEQAKSGPFAASPDAVPGMVKPGDVVVFATAVACLILLKWCVNAGDAGVRNRRGIPALPILAACTVIAFTAGVAAGVGVLFASALLCMGAYRSVLRMASGGYTDDGSMSGPEPSGRDAPAPTPPPGGGPRIPAGR